MRTQRHVDSDLPSRGGQERHASTQTDLSTRSSREERESGMKTKVLWRDMCETDRERCRLLYEAGEFPDDWADCFNLEFCFSPSDMFSED